MKAPAHGTAVPRSGSPTPAHAEEMSSDNELKTVKRKEIVRDGDAARVCTSTAAA